MCNSKTSLLISVIPLVIFKSNQSALARGEARIKKRKMVFLFKFSRSLKVIVRLKVCVLVIIKYTYDTL
jgi:hypothetical protein